MATTQHIMESAPPCIARSARAAQVGKRSRSTDEGSMDTRITKLEVILPMLATKADLESLRATLGTAMGDLKADFERGQKENRAWMLATVLALFVGLLALGGFLGRSLEQRLATASSSEQPATMALADTPATD